MLRNGAKKRRWDEKGKRGKKLDQTQILDLHYKGEKGKTFHALFRKKKNCREMFFFCTQFFTPRHSDGKDKPSPELFLGPFFVSLLCHKIYFLSDFLHLHPCFTRAISVYKGGEREEEGKANESPFFTGGDSK